MGNSWKIRQAGQIRWRRWHKTRRSVNLLINAESTLSTSISPHSIVDNCEPEIFVNNIGEEESRSETFNRIYNKNIGICDERFLKKIREILSS